MFYLVDDATPRPPWNKGKLIGQKKPLKLKETWTIRVRLQMAGDVRGLALFNMAIDSKLRACDLVKPRVTGVTHGSTIRGASHISTRQYSRIVHQWIDLVGLDGITGRTPCGVQGHH